jgi:hypothetical protein
MNNSEKTIYVYADWPELEGATLIGCLNAQLTRGKEIFSFEFDDNWLKSSSARMLDPDLLIPLKLISGYFWILRLTVGDVSLCGGVKRLEHVGKADQLVH